ncbi:hypothetical protein [Dysgonomonas macrotermitis]|uniref:Uncharacterized protein n=1 Tax=Dysgonomonas macrotermitis TaxID=1346286 RepID=A0A1M4UL46_9BACT|nr:hypothetical protein [Dysgonomonas macrotermitis]SHE57385.1 hypothetical protein SAMN05444362_101635 [Dysgonomonas macrotermitis]
MATKCDTATSPTSLEWCDGQINTPGIRSEVFFTPRRNILAWPTLPSTLAAGETMGKMATYQGNFALAAETVWNRMDIIISRSPVTSESQGTKPSKTYLNQATIVVPNTDQDAAGFARLANNDDYVYIVQETGGKYRVLGNEMYQTETNVATALGAAATDEKGTTLTIQVPDICPAPFYEGEIRTEDGIINETPDEAPESGA